MLERREQEERRRAADASGAVGGVAAAPPQCDDGARPRPPGAADDAAAAPPRCDDGAAVGAADGAADGAPKASSLEFEELAASFEDENGDSRDAPAAAAPADTEVEAVKLIDDGDNELGAASATAASEEVVEIANRKRKVDTHFAKVKHENVVLNDKLAKFMEEFQATVQCGICLGLLDEPVTLTCAHSFCSECFANQLFPSNCPTCRHPIPRTRGYAPAINTGLKHLIAQVQQFKSAEQGRPRGALDHNPS